jgi:hypothetical protein
MDYALSRLLTTLALLASAGVVSATACTRTTDRVVEPVSGPDAATPTSPEVRDGGVSPIGPIAHPVEPAEDFRLVRAPEFGLVRERGQLASHQSELQAGLGGIHAGGASGSGGSDLRPVASGGGYY